MRNSPPLCILYWHQLYAANYEVRMISLLLYRVGLFLVSNSPCTFFNSATDVGGKHLIKISHTSKSFACFLIGPEKYMALALLAIDIIWDSICDKTFCPLKPYIQTVVLSSNWHSLCGGTSKRILSSFATTM